MISEPMKLIITQYRAIHHAEIHLNGLTVVSGINGCGKSTISKMLHSIFEISSDFYPIVRLNNIERLEDYYKLLSFITDWININYHHLNLNHVLNSSKDSKNNKKLNLDSNLELEKIKKELNLIKLNTISEKEKEDVDSLLLKINKLIDEILDLYLMNKATSSPVIHLIRLHKIKFGFKYKKMNNETREIQEFFKCVKKDIESIVRKIDEEAFTTRPKKYLLDRLPLLFHTDEKPELVELYENGEPILGKDNKNIAMPFFIKNVIYLDSPMAFQSVNPNREHWDKINSLLVKKLSTNQLLPESNRLICNEILKVIGGGINIDSNNRILFTREKDNLKLELTDCATGIQSLSILFSLLNNNSINNNTLLILDEPEVHLHPQWITELARILVLIRKYVKCHIFISTHSTDMIRGLKYLSEQEKIQDNLNFFLAEESKDYPSKFDYVNLEDQIGKIFKCFNKSFEKLDSMMEAESE